MKAGTALHPCYGEGTRGWAELYYTAASQNSWEASKIRKGYRQIRIILIYSGDLSGFCSVQENTGFKNYFTLNLKGPSAHLLAQCKLKSAGWGVTQEREALGVWSLMQATSQ